MSQLLFNRKPHLAIFAECGGEPSNLVEEVNSSGGPVYSPVWGVSAKFVTLTRLPSGVVSPRHGTAGGYAELWAVALEEAPEFLVCGMHLPSLCGAMSLDGHALHASRVIQEIESIENDDKHRRTLIIGDFNSNPYDATLRGAFRGAMTRELCSKFRRLHYDYFGFYNPMWGLFGDRTKGPPGTYYLDSSDPSCTHWCMIDQILLRDAIIESLLDVEIIDHDGKASLLRDGRPDKIEASDHLPIICTIETGKVVQ